MPANQGGFEDEDDEYSWMSCLDTAKYRCLCCQFPFCNKFSFPEQNNEILGWKAGMFFTYCVPFSKEGFKQGTQHSTHEDAFAGSGVKAPFSLFRSWNSMLYFEPACAYYVCMSHSCWWICIFHKFSTIRVLVMVTVNCTIGDALILPWKTTAQQDHFFTSLV